MTLKEYYQNVFEQLIIFYPRYSIGSIIETMALSIKTINLYYKKNIEATDCAIDIGYSCG